MYHKVIIAGYLGQDPQMRYTASGSPVTNFSVATSRAWTNQAGEKQEETVWWRISAWGKMAEVCNEYLKKGRPVLIEGTMRPGENGSPRTWSGSDGVVRASYEVTAQTVKFLPSRNGVSGDVAEPASEPEPEPDLPF